MKHLVLPRWLSSPVLHISLLGILSWLVYLHWTLTYPLADYVARYNLTDFGRANDWRIGTLIDFMISAMVLLACCVLAWFVIRRFPHNRRLFWLVFGFAVLFSFTLLMMYPITSSDVFEYVFHSRILVHYGLNPMVVAPIAFKGDSFLKALPWGQHPSPYGPLWLLLTVPGGLIANNDFLMSLIVMKFLPLPFFLGSVLIIAAILQRMDANYRLAGTLLFAWNPPVLLEAIGNGHNDLIMMFFVLFAIYLMIRRKWVWVIPVLVASILIKWATAILVIPFLIYCWHAQPTSQARWKYLLKTSSISGALLIVLVLPFLAVPTGLLEESNFYSLLALPSVAYHFLRGIYGVNTAKVLTIGTGVLSYLAIYILSLRSLLGKLQPRHLILLSVFLILAYFGVACVHFQPWFVIWPLALGIWINHPAIRSVLLVFTCSALFSYVANFWWIWNYRVWGTLQVNVIFVLVIFTPPILIGILSRLTPILFQPNRMVAALVKLTQAWQ